jgi:phosphoribosylglycinamide formyltransferase 1
MSSRGKLKLAVLISGRGSNMLAIARACLGGSIAAEVVTVISDRREAEGIASAGELGLSTAVVHAKSMEGRVAVESELSAAIDQSGAELVLLAGFMRILSASFVQRYEGHLLNIHPSLLPNYKGLHTHRRVLAAGDAVHGASVHYVSDELDGGPIICQARLSVERGESEQSLAARVLQLEHRIYPLAVGLIATGRLELRAGRIVLDGEALMTPLAADTVPAHGALERTAGDPPGGAAHA